MDVSPYANDGHQSTRDVGELSSRLTNIIAGVKLSATGRGHITAEFAATILWDFCFRSKTYTEVIKSRELQDFVTSTMFVDECFYREHTESILGNFFVEWQNSAHALVSLLEERSKSPVVGSDYSKDVLEDISRFYTEMNEHERLRFLQYACRDLETGDAQATRRSIKEEHRGDTRQLQERLFAWDKEEREKIPGLMQKIWYATNCVWAQRKIVVQRRCTSS